MPRRVTASRVMTRLYGRGRAGPPPKIPPPAPRSWVSAWAAPPAGRPRLDGWLGFAGDGWVAGGALEQPANRPATTRSAAARVDMDDSWVMRVRESSAQCEVASADRN